MARRLWVNVLVVAICASLSSGCSQNESAPVGGQASQVASESSSGDGGMPAKGANSTGSNVDGLPGVAQASWSTEMEVSPPLATYAVYLEGPPEDEEYRDAMARWHDDTQSFIAECMSSRGFRWIPRPAPQVESRRVPVGEMLSLLPTPYLPDDRDLVEQQGYGVMGTVEEQAAEAGVTEDPNLDIWNGLSPAEAEAYDSALYGDPNNPKGTSGASCSGKAQARFPKPSESGEMQTFRAEFWDLVYSALASASADDRPGGLGDDSRVQGMNREWESCMNRRGYAFTKVGSEGGPILAMAQAQRTRPDGTVGPVRQGVLASDIPLDERRLLGTEPERAVALDDFDCRVEVNYITRLTDIRVARDEAFIAEHQAELDRLVAMADSW